MSELFGLDNLSKRLRRYVEQHPTLKSEAARLLEEALIRGEFERGEIDRITGLPERSARRVLTDLIDPTPIHNQGWPTSRPTQSLGFLPLCLALEIRFSGRLTQICRTVAGRAYWHWRPPPHAHGHVTRKTGMHDLAQLRDAPRLKPGVEERWLGKFGQLDPPETEALDAILIAWRFEKVINSLIKFVRS